MSAALDSSAMLALFRKENGCLLVIDALAEQSCYAHAANLCEVYYDFYRTDGEDQARQIITDLNALGVAFREDMDADFWQEAGKIKAEQARVSLADCFCIALARRLDVEVWTADHHEFDAVAEKRLCRVKFVR